MSAEDAHLHDLIFTRVAADTALPERSKELVLAAVEGEDALHAALRGERPVGDAAPVAPPADGGPNGIYLRSVRVRGFRGAGPVAVLDLQPGPGLTVVTGRNGSGKSTFAEAAELALTGENSRWTDKANNKALWQQGWRNLHADDTTEIAVELCTAGPTGATTVRMDWADGAGLGQESWTVQPHGEKRAPMSLGWVPDLTLFRPFLSYGELGAVVDKPPTKLYAAFHDLLGLGALDDARARLKDARGPLESRAKAVTDDRKQLLADLEIVDDDRARRAADLVRAPRPDLDAVAALVLTDDVGTETLGDLRAITALAVPTTDAVAAAAAAVAEAVQRVAAASTPGAVSAAAVGGLLQAALDHHTAHGDGACPVCRSGALDEIWRARTAAELLRLRQEAAALRAAQATRDTAVESALRLVSAEPQVLIREPGGLDVREVGTAWRAWDAVRHADPEVLAETLTSTHAALHGALATTQAAATDELVRLDETWRPLSARLWTWHADAERAATEAATVRELRKADDWIKNAATALSNDRIRPFATRSQKIWRLLKQESNVDLGEITLAGSGNQRKVLFGVEVDGSSGPALSVMSQGELHALGLALFLPRATRQESPFRFVLIDDPVQAMDPAKVDGLARVLSTIARTRQVVVFSHDDRLADAVRRLPEPARVVEVRRRERSQIDVVANSDPVARYLSDAATVIHDEAMPDELRREIVVNCCRGAIEAAAHAKVRRVRLGRGVAHVDVEEALAAAVTTHDKVTLAVFDDPGRGNDLLPRLDRAGRWAADTLQACKQGAHRGYRGDLGELRRRTRDFAARVLA